MARNAERLNWVQIRREILEGRTMVEVALRHGTNRARIAKRASREKWNIAAARGIEKCKGLASPGEEMARELVGMETEQKSLVREHRETMLAISMSSRRSLAEAIRKAMNYLSGLPEAELAKQHRALASLTNSAEALFGWRALAVVEGEAAAREVRLANGERDTRAINLELLRCSPEELRRRARAAQAAKVVEVEVRAEEGEKGVGG
jgi:hypothetical protein